MPKLGAGPWKSPGAGEATLGEGTLGGRRVPEPWSRRGQGLGLWVPRRPRACRASGEGWAGTYLGGLGSLPCMQEGLMILGCLGPVVGVRGLSRHSLGVLWDPPELQPALLGGHVY